MGQGRYRRQRGELFGAVSSKNDGEAVATGGAAQPMADGIDDDSDWGLLGSDDEDGGGAATSGEAASAAGDTIDDDLEFLGSDAPGSGPPFRKGQLTAPKKKKKKQKRLKKRRRSKSNRMRRR